MFLQKQRTHKNAILEELKTLPGLRFRTIPDEQGDSATFLSFSLPDESAARKSSQALAQAGVDGCFYWFDNMLLVGTTNINNLYHVFLNEKYIFDNDLNILKN